MEKALLDIKETSEYLGLGESMTRKIMKENLGVFATRIGNRYYASKVLLDKWINTSVKSKGAKK